MSIIVDYGLDSLSRALIILVLAIEDREQKKEMDILHIQKAIRYFEYLRQKTEIDFSNFKLGGVSYEIEENIETLFECDLIDKKVTKYFLTDESEKIVEELKKNFSQKEFQKLNFAKKQLNDLTNDELLYFMYKLIPETQKYSTEFNSLNKKRKFLVQKLFLKERINLNTALKWLGVSEREFLENLPSKD